MSNIHVDPDIAFELFVLEPLPIAVPPLEPDVAE